MRAMELGPLGLLVLLYSEDSPDFGLCVVFSEFFLQKEFKYPGVTDGWNKISAGPIDFPHREELAEAWAFVSNASWGVVLGRSH